MDLAEIDLTGSDSTEYPNSPEVRLKSDADSLNVQVPLTKGNWPSLSGDTLDTLSTNFNHNNNGAYDPGVVLGTDRKRCRRAMFDEAAIDDIMGQINEKLTFNQSEQLQRNNRIDAFIEVLGCSRIEAEFYLESSRWNVETAVVLWLENNPHPRTSFPSFFPDLFPGYDDTVTKTAKPKYIEREIAIEGLPKGWLAKVDPYDGHIYFQNLTTGYRQTNVPPGFADSEHASQSCNSTSSTRSSSYSTSSASAACCDANSSTDATNPNDDLCQWGTTSNETCYEEVNGFLIVKEKDEQDAAPQMRKIDNTPAWMNDCPKQQHPSLGFNAMQFDPSATSFAQLAQSLFPPQSQSQQQQQQHRTVSWEDDQLPPQDNRLKMPNNVLMMNGNDTGEGDDIDGSRSKKKVMPWGTPRETGLSSGMDDDDADSDSDNDLQQFTSSSTTTLLPPPPHHYISSSSSSSGGNNNNNNNNNGNGNGTEEENSVGYYYDPTPATTTTTTTANNDNTNNIFAQRPSIFQYSSSSSSYSTLTTNTNTTNTTTNTNTNTNTPDNNHNNTHHNNHHNHTPLLSSRSSSTITTSYTNTSSYPPAAACNEEDKKMLPSEDYLPFSSSLSSSSSSSSSLPFAIPPHYHHNNSNSNSNNNMFTTFGSTSFSPTNPTHNHNGTNTTNGNGNGKQQIHHTFGTDSEYWKIK